MLLVEPYPQEFVLRETHDPLLKAGCAAFWVVAECGSHRVWYDPATGNFGLGECVRGLRCTSNFDPCPRGLGRRIRSHVTVGALAWASPPIIVWAQHRKRFANDLFISHYGISGGKSLAT